MLIVIEILSINNIVCASRAYQVFRLLFSHAMLREIAADWHSRAMHSLLAATIALWALPGLLSTHGEDFIFILRHPR